MRKSHEAREKLLRLGIFRQVDVLIDTCQGTRRGVVSLITPPVHPAASQKLNVRPDVDGAWRVVRHIGLGS